MATVTKPLLTQNYEDFKIPIAVKRKVDEIKDTHEEEPKKKPHLLDDPIALRAAYDLQRKQINDLQVRLANAESTILAADQHLQKTLDKSTQPAQEEPIKKALIILRQKKNTNPSDVSSKSWDWKN